MASGLAVVSADVDSASALIDHGRTGLLVPPQDPGAYAAAAASLIDQPARRSRLGRAAAEVADRYRWDAVLADVARVYERLAGRDVALHYPALARQYAA